MLLAADGSSSCGMGLTASAVFRTGLHIAFMVPRDSRIPGLHWRRGVFDRRSRFLLLIAQKEEDGLRCGLVRAAFPFCKLSSDSESDEEPLVPSSECPGDGIGKEEIRGGKIMLAVVVVSIVVSVVVVVALGRRNC